MTSTEKIRVAHALAQLGVDIIEAGFPAASDDDFHAVQKIAREIHGPTICALARCHKADIHRAWESIQSAPKPRLHVFLATSPIHREHKLQMTQNEVLHRIREGVRRARDLCDDVEFSPEDGSRTEPDFLAETLETALQAGATTLNIPDTVGYSLPSESKHMFEEIVRHVRGTDSVVLSAHCHDDLGLAAANSLAAIQGGARQIECTINGIGERAGNCALEEIVMALHARRDTLHLHTGIDHKRLVPTSKIVAMATASPTPRNKAIVGANAFAHESGIHQHGMLANRNAYEIIDPIDVGLEGSTLVLGKHSGKHAVKDRVSKLGYKLKDNQIDDLTKRIKALGDTKKTIYDADIEALLRGHDPAGAGPWHLCALHVSTDLRKTATVTVRNDASDTIQSEAATGDGPVDAIFEAIKRITKSPLRLLEFRVQSVTLDSDAQGEATVDVLHNNTHQLRGRGVSTDILEAMALAVLDVVNQTQRTPSHAIDTLPTDQPLPLRD